MSQLTQRVLEQVNSREEAEQIVAALLTEYGSDTAVTRVEREARTAKQSVSEVTRRRVSNFFRGLTTRK